MEQLANVNLLPSESTRDLIAGSGGFHVARICKVLGVETSEFARLSERRVESVAKLFKKETVKPRNEKTVEVLHEMIQIITILRAMGLSRSAARWMKTPIPSFSGKTPTDLIAQGHGQELIGRLTSNASGNVGS